MNARPSPFDSLKPLAGRALELALNHLLSLDPETRDGLSALEGRRIELELEAPALALAITVRERQLRVGPPERESEADLGLRTGLAGLLGQLPFLRDRGGAPVGKLRIQGDADLARRLQQLARQFDPDWQRPFAEALGPVLGPQVARVLAEGLRAGTRAAGSFARDAAEYVTEESRDVVGKGELAAFHDDVDAVRDRVERVAARVERLRARDGSPT